MSRVGDGLSLNAILGCPAPLIIETRYQFEEKNILPIDEVTTYIWDLLSAGKFKYK
jgi:hypothetical protein